MRVVFEVVERHKLNDISRHVLPICLRIERLFIAIKYLHRAEISITNTHNNDGDWKVGAANNLINCLVHICDDTICNYQAYVELLIHLIDIRRSHLIVHFVKNFVEICRAIQIAILQGFLIMSDYLHNTIDSWIKDVAV